MMGSIERFLALSIAVHILLLGVSSIALRKAKVFIMPSPYMVRLVSPDSASERVGEQAAQGKAAEKPAPSKPQAKTSDAAFYDDYVSERLAALKAKKKVEEIVKLRRMVSLKKEAPAINKKTAAGPPYKGATAASMDIYIAKITGLIRKEWVFPALDGGLDLEAVISIYIMKDGTIKIKEIEKSSGNPVFDRSALRALGKASPLEPPPYELEVGVRFHP